MDSDARGFIPQEGMSVIGSDGERIGEIDVVESAYVIVRQGLFPQDYYIPLAAITSHDEDAVHLNITKDEAMERGLGNPMVAFAEPGSGGERPAVVADTLVGPEGEPEAAVTGAAIESEPEVDLTMEATDDAIIAADEATREDERHQTIQLHQEEVSATTRPVERGVVRISKDVVEERQTFEVPIVEEEVVVTRRRVDRDPGDERELFTEDHFEIPLRGHEVEIETRAHVTEEIEIGKTAHERIERVTETVRHEEVRVEGDGVELDAGDAERGRRDDSSGT